MRALVAAPLLALAMAPPLASRVVTAIVYGSGDRGVRPAAPIWEDRLTLLGRVR